MWQTSGPPKKIISSMPSISKKAREMPSSPIRKLVPFANSAKARGVEVLHLNIGQPDIETPKEMLDAVRHFDSNVVEYSDSAGMLDYRQRIAEHYNTFADNLSEDNVIVTTGASEALLFTVLCCLDPGEEIIVPEPLYPNYNSFCSAADVNISPIKTNIDDNFALPAIEEFEENITYKTKAILICNPNNPTGYVYSRGELETLRDICIKHDLYLIVDEVYRDFVYEGEFESVLNIEGLESNLVVIDSISKKYSSCGARIGMIVSRNKSLLQSMLKFAQARLSPPTFGQVAGIAAFDVPKDYFKKVKREYQDRRDFLVSELSKIEGVNCPKPKGAFYVFVDLPIEDSEHFCRWMLESFSHKNSTIMLAPGSGFYASSSGKNQVRIAYVLNKEKLAMAVKCLDEGLKSYNEKNG